MKELSIEEKAKRYDEAIERANELIYVSDKDSLQRKTVEHIFPELKESEDERIRKELINGFNKLDKSVVWYDGITNGQILAWLEKQGNINPTEDELEALRMAAYEPTKNWSEKLQSLYMKLSHCEQGEKKPADKVEPKFKTGDWIIHNTYYNLIYYVDSILSPQSNCYCLNSNGGTRLMNFSEQDNYHLWTIQDAKDGDVLATKAGGIFIYKELLYDKPFAYCGVDKFGVFKDCNCGNGLDWTPYLSDVTPATKKQSDALMKTMADAGWEFDFDKKELKKIEQNIAWNENDKEIWEEISNILWKGYKKTYSKFSWDDIRNWLKPKVEFSKCRVQPQPRQECSEEEIEKAAQEWDSKANFNPFYMIMDGDKPTDVKQDITTHKESFKAGVNWILKSLRPQSQWKPSEEQIKALEHFVRSVGESGYTSPYDNNTKLLYSLLSDLKKLRCK